MVHGRSELSILDSLGIDPENFTWENLAICQGMPTDWFFDQYEADVTVAKQIDEACLSCPVMAMCANKGREDKEHGVFGGIYWNGSGKPDKNKNNHKTPEVWEQIRDRLTNET